MDENERKTYILSASQIVWDILLKARVNPVENNIERHTGNDLLFSSRSCWTQKIRNDMKLQFLLQQQTETYDQKEK